VTRGIDRPLRYPARLPNTESTPEPSLIQDSPSGLCGVTVCHLQCPSRVGSRMGPKPAPSGFQRRMSAGDHAGGQVDVGAAQSRHVQHRSHRLADLCSVTIRCSAERDTNSSSAARMLVPVRSLSHAKLRSIRGPLTSPGDSEFTTTMRLSRKLW